MIKDLLGFLSANWEVLAGLAAMLGAAFSPWTKIIIDKLSRKQLTEEEIDLAKINNNNTSISQLRDYMLEQHTKQQEKINEQYAKLQEDNLRLQVTQVQLETELKFTRERVEELMVVITELRVLLKQSHADYKEEHHWPK